MLFERLQNSGRLIHPVPVLPVNQPEVLLLNVSFMNKDGKPISKDSLKQGAYFVAKASV